MDRKVGVDHPFDDAYLLKTLYPQIQINQDQIHVAEELRAVIIRPTSPAAPRSAAVFPRRGDIRRSASLGGTAAWHGFWL